MGVRKMQGSPWHTELNSTPWLFCLCRYKDETGACTCITNKENYKNNCIGRKACSYYEYKSSSGFCRATEGSKGRTTCCYSNEDGVCNLSSCVNAGKPCMNPFLCKKFADEPDPMINFKSPFKEPVKKKKITRRKKKGRRKKKS